jgi:hypothetical protein
MPLPKHLVAYSLQPNGLVVEGGHFGSDSDTIPVSLYEQLAKLGRDTIAAHAATLTNILGDVGVLNGVEIVKSSGFGYGQKGVGIDLSAPFVRVKDTGPDRYSLNREALATQFNLGAYGRPLTQIAFPAKDASGKPINPEYGRICHGDTFSLITDGVDVYVFSGSDFQTGPKYQGYRCDTTNPELLGSLTDPATVSAALRNILSYADNSAPPPRVAGTRTTVAGRIANTFGKLLRLKS